MRPRPFSIRILLACAGILALASCGTGLSVHFGPDGIVIVPPTDPIVIIPHK